MKIGFIGAGNMAEAYISSLENEAELFFYEINETRSKFIKEKYKIKQENNLLDLINSSEYIILSVKPHIIEIVLNQIKDFGLDSKYILSIAAGVTIEKIENIIGENKKIARIMPNTPALIKKGVSGISFNKMIDSEEEKQKIIDIIKATGLVIPIEENKMDVLTAISGSGPAYVFLLINSIAEGGVKLGMDKATSLKLATETFIGAAELIKQTQKHPEQLKDMVTSPGGTTAAGLYTMEENGVRKAMIETVESAYKKAKEL